MSLLRMKILLVGGGSGGPVAPLLAVAEEIQQSHPKAKFLLVGTKVGPENLMAKQAGIPFVSIPAGKWRRYFSLANIATPFLVIAGFLKARTILKDFKPDCVFGAGSFVQVPVIWAAKFLKIPVVIHQQDLYPSLANTICQTAANKITVTFENSQTDFYQGLGFSNKKKQSKVFWTGNPCRPFLKLATKEVAAAHFKLKEDLPTLLVLGGGTGAEFLNNLVKKSLPKLSQTVQIIHSTGKGRGEAKPTDNYHPFEFIPEMDLAYAAADLVLCRAGLSTITELSNLKKISIIVPMPGTHQEGNASLLMHLGASIVLTQKLMDEAILLRIIRKLLFDPHTQQQLKDNIAKVMPKNSAKKIADLILEVIEKYGNK